MDSTWQSREVPVLTATVGLFEEAGNIGVVRVSDIAQRSGLDADDVFTSLMAMKDIYVELHLVMAGGDPNPQMVSAVSAEARRLVGQWPTPEALTDQILEGLSSAANAETDPVRKSKLQALADGATAVGKEVLVNVITGVILGSH